MQTINFIILNIGKAFVLMSDFEVLPGISLLQFSVFLLVQHTLFDIFWFGAKSYARGETAAQFAVMRKEQNKANGGGKKN